MKLLHFLCYSALLLGTLLTTSAQQRPCWVNYEPRYDGDAFYFFRDEGEGGDKNSALAKARENVEQKIKNYFKKDPPSRIREVDTFYEMKNGKFTYYVLNVWEKSYTQITNETIDTLYYSIEAKGLGLLLPGYGQFKQKQPVTGAIFLVTGLGALIEGVLAYNNRKNYIDKAWDPSISTNSDKVSEYNALAKNQNSYFYLSAGVLVVDIVLSRILAKGFPGKCGTSRYANNMPLKIRPYYVINHAGLTLSYSLSGNKTPF